MPEHELIAAANVHTVYRKVFADEAARLADASDYSAVELNIKAIQVDTAIEYRLTAISPVTWTAVGVVGGGGFGGSGFLAEVVQQNVGVTLAQLAQGGTASGVLLGLDLSDIPATKCGVSVSVWVEGIWGDATVANDIYVAILSFAAGGGDPGTRLVGSEETTVLQEVNATNTIGIFIDNAAGPNGDLSVEIFDDKGANGTLDVRFTASRGAYNEV